MHYEWLKKVSITNNVRYVLSTKYNDKTTTCKKVNLIHREGGGGCWAEGTTHWKNGNMRWFLVLVLPTVSIAYCFKIVEWAHAFRVKSLEWRVRSVQVHCHKLTIYLNLISNNQSFDVFWQYAFFVGSFPFVLLRFAFWTSNMTNGWALIPATPSHYQTFILSYRINSFIINAMRALHGST